MSFVSRSLCCIIACWTEPLPARGLRVGVVYAIAYLEKIGFLEALTFLASVISLASVMSAFPALLSAYYVFITPKFALISNYIF